MSILNVFRRPKPIADSGELDDFVAAETAFIVQKTIWEYSRARSGVLWQKLFKEVAFKYAVEASCWRNYPLGLAFVGEMVAGTLRSETSLGPGTAVAGARASALRVIARHPLPLDFEASFWDDTAAFVTGRINRTLVAQPKAVKDIPLDGHTIFFNQLPIHPDLTKHDARLLRNALRVHLCRAYETLQSRLDRAAIAEAIAAEENSDDS